MKTKTIITLFLFAFFTLQSYGVPYPEKILWKDSPKNFIHSLYQGVLGRNPENQAVVNSWATTITNQNSSRVNTFWKFIQSKEYQSSRWAKQQKLYSIYYKTIHNKKVYKRYYISKFGRDHYVKGRYSFGVAMALKNYIATFDKKSETYNSSNTNSINLFNTTIKGT